MKTIVLAGSGHANLEIIKSLTPRLSKSHHFILISPDQHTFYSGMIPRLIMGDLKISDLTIDSAQYAQKKGVEYIEDSVSAIDVHNSNIILGSGQKIKFDILSLNIGAKPSLISSDDDKNTVYLKPLNRFVEKWLEIESLFDSGRAPLFVVVGGGAAAVEVASALQERLNRKQNNLGRVQLVASSSRLCVSYTERISRAIAHDLKKLGVIIQFNEMVTHINSNHINLAIGKKLEFDKIFVATPSSVSQLGEFFSVDAFLQFAPKIFASGDCATQVNDPQPPKSGVIAVQQGRYLAKAISATLNNRIPPEFKASNRQINILLTGKRSGRLVYGNASVEGYLPLILKKIIDNRYIEDFI